MDIKKILERVKKQLNTISLAHLVGAIFVGIGIGIIAKVLFLGYFALVAFVIAISMDLIYTGWIKKNIKSLLNKSVSILLLWVIARGLDGLVPLLDLNFATLGGTVYYMLGDILIVINKLRKKYGTSK